MLSLIGFWLSSSETVQSEVTWMMSLSKRQKFVNRARQKFALRTLWGKHDSLHVSDDWLWLDIYCQVSISEKREMEQILISERLSCYQGCTSSGTSNFTEKKNRQWCRSHGGPQNPLLFRQQSSELSGRWSNWVINRLICGWYVFNPARMKWSWIRWTSLLGTMYYQCAVKTKKSF